MLIKIECYYYLVLLGVFLFSYFLFPVKFRRTEHMQRTHTERGGGWGVNTCTHTEKGGQGCNDFDHSVSDLKEENLRR